MYDHFISASPITIYTITIPAEPEHEQTDCLYIFAAWIVLSQPASSNLFTFSQAGFEDDATVTGSFTGKDLNNDGVLTLVFLEYHPGNHHQSISHHLPLN